MIINVEVGYMNLIDLFKDSTGYEPIPEITLKILGLSDERVQELKSCQ